jgi:hypothetical protein
MTQDRDDERLANPAGDQRKARLAEQLRRNLRQRKAQTRARRQGEAETGEGLPASSPKANDPGRGKES